MSRASWQAFNWSLLSNHQIGKYEEALLAAIAARRGEGEGGGGGLGRQQEVVVVGGSGQSSDQEIGVGGGSEEEEWWVGQRVLVLGLTASPELNGRRGEVLGWNGKGDRLEVKLQPGHSCFALKPCNLRSIFA